MKLKELLEKDIRVIPGKSSIEPTLSYKLKRLGAGVQGMAFKHPRSTNMIIKTARVSNPETDSYVKFIKLALEHQDNPFFPRIYDAVLRTLPNNEYELVVQMERLHKLSSRELADITPQLFKRLGFKLEDIEEDMWEYLNDPDVWDFLIKNTKNPKLAEALSLLLQADPTLRRHDLHFDNWMVRLTSVGPQLVIIDPFIGQF